MDGTISRFLIVWCAWGALAVVSASEIESISPEQFFEIEDRILRSTTDDNLKACVKLCVSVDPRSGKVVFSGGNLDCVEQCHRSLTGRQGDQEVKETQPGETPTAATETTTAPTTTSTAAAATAFAKRLFGPYGQMGNQQDTVISKEQQTGQSKESQQQQNQVQQQGDAQYPHRTGAKEDDVMVAQESRQHLSISAPPPGFFMKDEPNRQGPEMCKKIAEFDTQPVRAASPLLPGFEQRRSSGAPPQPTQSHQGPVPDINTIFSTVHKGWQVLEDLCEIYSRARNFHMPQSRPLSDKAVMCNVLQATSQDPHFQKDQCLRSVEVDDLIRGCASLAAATGSGTPTPSPHVNSLMHVQYQHKDPRHHGHHGPNSGSLSLTIPTDPTGKGGTSQKLALCVNAEFLRTREVDSIKNLETDIERKKNLVEKLEEKISKKCNKDHSTTHSALDAETALAFTGPIPVDSTQLTAERREDLVSRRTCLRDFSMLRKTMNEVLAKLEEKYRSLSVKERTACAGEGEAIMRAEGREAYKMLDDLGQQSTTFTATDDTSTTSTEAATNPSPNPLPPMINLKGILEVDPIGRKEATLTFRTASETGSPAPAVDSTTSYASSTTDNRTGQQQQSTKAEINLM